MNIDIVSEIINVIDIVYEGSLISRHSFLTGFTIRAKVRLRRSAVKELEILNYLMTNKFSSL